MKNFKLKTLIAIMSAVISLGAFAKDETSDISYEVKFVLDEKVLDSNDKSKVSESFIKTFDLGKVTPIKVVYIDTDKRTFLNEGWINRLRVKGGAKKFEYTFKKRYSVKDENLDAALELAKADGLIGADGFEAEVDWSFDKMTLSYKFDADITNEGFGELELPNLAEAVKTAGKNMPQTEVTTKGKKWGSKSLKKANFIGPVVFRRYKGKLNGQKIDVEVWPIENQKTKETTYFAELSFDADSYEEAKNTRQIIMEKLSELGVLKQESSLKTNAMYDAYTK